MEREPAQFGPNSWLIDEMYQQALESPDSVAEPWRDFFADYHPDGGKAKPAAPEAAKPAPPEAAKSAPPEAAKSAPPEAEKPAEATKEPERKEAVKRVNAEQKKAAEEVPRSTPPAAS